MFQSFTSKLESLNPRLQFRWISKDFEDVRKLKQAYIAKALIAIALIFLAIGFAIALYVGSRHDNEIATFVGGEFPIPVFLPSNVYNAHPISGILEWVIAFGFVFYLLTFYFDLRMSKGMHKGDLSKERLTAMQHNGTLLRNGHVDGPGELAHDGRGHRFV
jgi:hypothetical protein